MRNRKTVWSQKSDDDSLKNIERWMDGRSGDNIAREKGRGGMRGPESRIGSCPKNEGGGRNGKK